MAEALHEPVLLDEVVKLLGGRETVVDATLGAGGHTEALLDAGVERVFGIDRDPQALAAASERLDRFGRRFVALRAPFSELRATVGAVGLDSADGVLYDLGVSSIHLDNPERGFSYRHDGPLDMRMDPRGNDAREIVNRYEEERLAEVIFRFGEERMSRRIARAIVRARERRPIETTGELSRIVAGAVPKKRGGPHPARRTFQALRIEVNGEMQELGASLPQASALLSPRGRLVAISYHSLEDRIVKRFVIGEDSLSALTPKPVRAGAAESGRNPRARAAKLRAAEKVAA